MNNKMEVRFPAIPENEAFSRMIISAFIMPSNPTLSLISEVRTAVSEAVTNAIVHAYGESGTGEIVIRAALVDQRLTIEVEDHGCGIEDIELAMRPFFTTQPEKERTGMGFSLMQSFMDGVHVRSKAGEGTVIAMNKMLCSSCDDIL